jgi:hypothetical protein
VFALPFIGIRLVYGIMIFIDDLNNKENSTFATSKPLKYLLSAIPEFIAICIFCYVGIKSRHISKLLKGSKYTVVEGVGPAHHGPHDDRVPLTYMPPQQDGVYEPYKQQYTPQTTLQPAY